MKRRDFFAGLFILLCIVCFYLFYKLIVPFFVPIAWAIILAITFHPLFRWFSARMKSPDLAATAVCVVVLLLILGPVSYLFIALVNEAYGIVRHVDNAYKSGELQRYFTYDPPWFSSIKIKLSPYMDVSNINLAGLVRDAIEKVTGLVVGKSTWIATNVTKSLLYFFIIMFSLFYFLRDGNRWVDKLKRITPLTNSQIDATYTQLREIIEATMYSGVAIALLQGLLGGIIFWIFGLQSPIFWGAVMAFLSLIPFIGGFLVYIPGGLILIFDGSPGKGILVIALGIILVSQADNFLRPYLLAGRTALHPLLLFFTLMGGVLMFGLLGVVIGPVIAAVFFTLVRIIELKLTWRETKVDEVD
ncbi:MAG: AI-2E family transporter [candidate division Zixibacteria bacterium]|nr:AI-2E family transporter [candidate division Zixibacteria bacterium]